MTRTVHDFAATVAEVRMAPTAHVVAAVCLLHLDSATRAAAQEIGDAETRRDSGDLLSQRMSQGHTYLGASRQQRAEMRAE